MEKEMEGLSDEEREAKGKEMEKELEDCPAMKEMQGLMGEMMMNGIGELSPCDCIQQQLK